MEKEIDALKNKETIYSQKFDKLLEIMKSHPEEMMAIVQKDKERMDELFN